MKKILALLLTLVMIFSVVACKNEEPEETTAPEVTTPNTPSNKDETPDDDYKVEIPTASKLLASVIGAISATLEVSEDTELVYVYESYEDAGTGFKTFLFVEVAEATVNSDGEELNADLKLKLGAVQTDLDSDFDKKDAQYVELNISVKGEDISVSGSVGGETQTETYNLSEILYGAVLEMMGMSEMAELEALVQNAFIAQELEKNLLLMLEELLTSEDRPTVTTEYVEHIQALFESIGVDMLVTTTDANGNTTYTWDLTALKALVEEFENKTFVQYLTEVYGKTVADEFVSFLENLPEKKVKDIVDAAVTLAENADVSIKEVYALINLYVESVTGGAFDIEAQINDRYNKTLAELLVEINGIPAEDQKEFIDSMKLGFKQVAEMLKNATIDEVLTSIFTATGLEGSFCDTLKSGIDMLNDMVTFIYTVDADGMLVELTYGIGDFQYSVKVEGNDTIISLTAPNGIEATATVTMDGFAFAVTQNEELVVAGAYTVTTTTEGEDSITTVVADLQDAENDLFDYTAVTVNGALSELKVVIRGYDVVYNGAYDSVTGEKYETSTRTFETRLVASAVVEDNGLTVTIFDTEDESTVLGTIEFAVEDNQLNVVVAEGDGTLLADFALGVVVSTEGDAQVFTLNVDVDYFEVQNDDWAKTFAILAGSISLKIA